RQCARRRAQRAHPRSGRDRGHPADPATRPRRNHRERPMKTCETLRILIADDHAIVREGLKQILAETREMAVVGEADNGLDAIRLARQTEADILLLDISMPDKSGIEVLKQVRKEAPHLAVLMLSMHREDQYAIRSLKA